MDISYSKQAIKVINGLDKPAKQRIRNAIEQLPKGDIAVMQGYKDGRLRLRVGKYRVVYILNNNEKKLYIMNIGSRGDIYK